MSKFFDLIKTKRGRGFMTVLGWAASLFSTLWTSHHELLALGVAMFACAWPLVLFWPEIKMLRDGYLLDSPSPNRLWFWFTSRVKDPIQGDGLDCQRLLH